MKPTAMDIICWPSTVTSPWNMFMTVLLLRTSCSEMWPSATPLSSISPRTASAEGLVNRGRAELSVADVVEERR